MRMRKIELARLLREWRADRIGFRNSNMILDNGRPFGDCLTEWQQTDFFDVLERRGTNKLFYVMKRGTGKTTLAAMYALETIILGSNEEVLVVATDQDVAALITDEINGLCERNPIFNAIITRNKNEIKFANSRITVISSDAASSFGFKPTLVICDELSNWAKESSETLFWSLFSSIAKRPGARILILSNSGAAYSRLYFEIRQKAETNSDDWYFFAPQEIETPWISAEEIESQRRNLPPSQFMRLFQNIDVPAAGNFISAEEIEDSLDDSMRRADRGNPEKIYFLGFDYGRKNDRSAATLLHAEGDLIVVDDIWFVKGTKERPVPFELVEGRILHYASRFHIANCLVDPFQMVSTVERLRGKIPMSEFPFSQTSWNVLARSLYDAIHLRRLRMFRDPIVINELLRLMLIETPQGLKFDHTKGQYSDICTSLGLAVVACQRAGGGVDEPVFDLGSVNESTKMFGELDRIHERRSARSHVGKAGAEDCGVASIEGETGSILDDLNL